MADFVPRFSGHDWWPMVGLAQLRCVALHELRDVSCCDFMRAWYVGWHSQHAVCRGSTCHTAEVQGSRCDLLQIVGPPTAATVGCVAEKQALVHLSRPLARAHQSQSCVNSDLVVSVSANHQICRLQSV